MICSYIYKAHAIVYLKIDTPFKSLTSYFFLVSISLKSVYYVYLFLHIKHMSWYNNIDTPKATVNNLNPFL